MANHFNAARIFWGLLAFAAWNFSATAAPASGSIEDDGCYARWTGRRLTVGNAGFEWSWVLQDHGLRSLSLSVKTGGQWLAAVKNEKPSSQSVLQVNAAKGPFSPVEAASIKLRLTAQGGEIGLDEVQVFPGINGVIIHRRADARKLAVAKRSQPENSNGVEEINTNEIKAVPGSGFESLALRPGHLKLVAVSFMDATDHHDELVSQREWLLHPSEESIDISGNLIFIEDTVTGEGLAALKLAPLPYARPVKSAVDFVIKPRSQTLQINAADYPVAVLAYAGGRMGRTEALHEFQRQLRKPDAQRDARFLSNTWGDRSRDARITEGFVRQEIAAGAGLGVEVVQIDDGWQTGRTKNSAHKGGVWGSWWDNPHFWDVNTNRFPSGLAPLAQDARAHGLQIGLWFAPDSSKDAAHWERDANRILQLHRDYGINYFKIDSLSATTPAAAANQKKMFDKVLNDSHGQVVLDLDVTSGVRPGYFGLLESGPLFLENRYTDSRNYWPHDTLRNLWMLSQYVDPSRLRIEFLNNARNLQKYGNDPLAPGCYAPDTLFAITMMANPLGWFEVSGLSKTFTSQVAPLVAIWKRERPQLLAGTTIPIGKPPDGMAWTGFASVNPPEADGYVLLFRELNGSPDFNLDLNGLFGGQVTPTILAGRGSAQVKGMQLQVRIPATLDFVWIRLRAANVADSASPKAAAAQTQAGQL